MRRTLIKLILALMMVGTVGSCFLYDDYQASRPANIIELEARLVQAGFRRVPIETPEQNGAVAELPMHRLNRYQSARGSVFWYVDPTICQCLYVGDQKAFDSYAGILQQEHDTAEYVNDVEPEQVVYLSPFGYAFPPPVLFGSWPVVVHHGPYGPFHSPGRAGGGGVGVRPHPGCVGITSHGHGGGHRIGGHGGGGHR